MLVLSRKRDEKIVIADTIVITVVEIRGDKVRLGIEAPKDVPVHREEVYRSIQKEQQAAASAVTTTPHEELVPALLAKIAELEARLGDPNRLGVDPRD